MSEREAIEAIADFQQYSIERCGFTGMQRLAFDLACRYQRSAYDSAYLALAESKGLWFFTGDKKLFNAVGGTLTWVKWIGDYQVDIVPGIEI